MKIVITGHTSGLGKALFEYFSTNHDIHGCSRVNGYGLPENIDKVVELAKNSDLFINNAHVGITQAEFIKLLHKNCPIITSGSIGADYFGKTKLYYNQKKIIEITHKKYKKKTQNPMLLLKMGYLENYPDKFPINYSEIINSVDYWLSHPRISMIEFENDSKVYGAF